MDRIPVSRPDLNGNEEKYVVEAIRSTWISSTGVFVTRFETEFAELCGTTSAIGVSNGTVALHLALLALGVGAGDEVIVPSLTYVATANAVRYVGAEPVFVDVDPATWCIDPGKIEDVVTPRTRGIIAVHLYGHPADMDEINRLAAIHGLWVVEDAAEAHTARYRGRPVGSLSTIATFSFFGNKILTSGEGGALTLSNAQLDVRARTLRGQGVDPTRRYFFPVVGYNFRITNLACAILCAQLERTDELLSARRRVFEGYADRLRGVEGLEFQPVADWAEPAPWLFALTIDPAGFGRDRDSLALELEQGGIETRPFFFPLHRLPPYRRSRHHPDGLSVTDRLGATGINLPTYPGMTDSELDRVAEAVVASHMTGGSRVRGRSGGR